MLSSFKIFYVPGKSLFYLELMRIYSMLSSLTLVYLTRAKLLGEELVLSSCFPPLFVFFLSRPLSLSISQMRGDDEC